LSQDQFFGRSNVAKHILETVSPDYYEAFRNYLSDPGKYSARAALTLTSANGGYLLPFVLDPTIILTNRRTANRGGGSATSSRPPPARGTASTPPVSPAAWLSDGGTAADASPTVANVVVTPDKAAAWGVRLVRGARGHRLRPAAPPAPGGTRRTVSRRRRFATNTTAGIPVGIVPAATTVVTTATTLVVARPTSTPPRPRATAVPQRARVRVGGERRPDQPGPPARHRRWRVVLDEPRQGPARNADRRAHLRVDHDGLGAGRRDPADGVRVTSPSFIIVDRVGVSMIYEPLVKGSGSPLPSGQIFAYVETKKANPKMIEVGVLLLPHDIAPCALWLRARRTFCCAGGENVYAILLESGRGGERPGLPRYRALPKELAIRIDFQWLAGDRPEGLFPTRL